jgi:hypothetical protein
MTVRDDLLTLSCRAIAAVVMVLAAGVALPDDISRQHAIVACVSEHGSAWRPKAQGTLTVSKSAQEQTYSWDFGEHSFWSRITSNADGTTSISGPGLLIGRLVKIPTEPEAPKFPRGPINALEGPSEFLPRGQRSSVAGEIREYAGPIFLVVVIGSKCPAGP